MNGLKNPKTRTLNLKSTVEALPYFIAEKNELFTKHNIFSEQKLIQDIISC